MTACRKCGASLCDCTDAEWNGLLRIERNTVQMPDSVDADGITIGRTTPPHIRDNVFVAHRTSIRGVPAISDIIGAESLT